MNQLLVELDGFDARVGVILMAATNRPEILDPALLRAGRFDRHVLVDRPDKIARLEILKLHASKVTIESEADLEVIASMTVGFVGADLANIINEAALLGVRRDRETVGLPELQEAVERVVAGLEKKNRVLSPGEKKRVAYHELGHALVAHLGPGRRRGAEDLDHPARHRRPRLHDAGADRGSLPHDRGRAQEQGGDAARRPRRRGAHLRRGLDRRARRPQQGDRHRAQHGQDLRHEPAARPGQLREGSAPHHVPFAPRAAARGDYSEQTARAIDDEVRRIIDEQRDRVAEILSRRHEVLLRAAQVLMAKETITGAELRELLAAHDAESLPAAEHDGRAQVV